MSIPKLKKIKSEKKYHDLTLSDEYAWVDQPNILEVLKDANKLDSKVKDYISANNKISMIRIDKANIKANQNCNCDLLINSDLI